MPWYVCDGLCGAKDYPLEQRLFFASAGPEEYEPKCPRCGACCPNGIEDYPPEDRERLIGLIRATIL